MTAIVNSAFFGAVISIAAYGLGVLLKKRFNYSLVNPLLISIVIVIVVLLVFHIDYETYNKGGQYISYLLTPATGQPGHSAVPPAGSAETA